MIYSSLLFIYVFLPVCLIVYHFMPDRYRNRSLLAMSLVFCAFGGIGYLSIVLMLAGINYAAGLLIDRLRGKSNYAAVPLVFGITGDLLLMFLFRSGDFPLLAGAFGFRNGAYPIGMAFMVLSGISYLADIYYGSVRAERSLVTFGLYMFMFPRVIMGPLLRYGSFRKVITNRHYGLNEKGIGFTLFVKGLAKKVIAADSLYSLYSAVTSVEPDDLSAVSAWLGSIAYVLCLYFTLSGYADMGCGLGYCFGYRFPQSFNYPLFTNKIRFFASKWHIQVVHWFRKYITRPLSSRTENKWLKRIVFIAAWGLLGFWYTFRVNGIIWGALIGAFIIAESYIHRIKTLNATGLTITFAALVLFSPFLSGSDTAYSFHYLKAMVGGNRLFADSLTMYLLRCYLVIVLISIYASTDLFRNMMIRSGKSRIRDAVSASVPAVVILLFVICTALMAYNGRSDMLLMRL